jgi:hypothetical protein
MGHNLGLTKSRRYSELHNSDALEVFNSNTLVHQECYLLEILSLMAKDEAKEEEEFSCINIMYEGGERKSVYG